MLPVLTSTSKPLGVLPRLSRKALGMFARSFERES